MISKQPLPGDGCQVDEKVRCMDDDNVFAENGRRTPPPLPPRRVKSTRPSATATCNSASAGDVREDQLAPSIPPRNRFSSPPATVSSRRFPAAPLLAAVPSSGSDQSTFSDNSRVQHHLLRRPPPPLLSSRSSPSQISPNDVVFSSLLGDISISGDSDLPTTGSSRRHGSAASAAAAASAGMPVSIGRYRVRRRTTVNGTIDLVLEVDGRQVCETVPMSTLDDVRVIAAARRSVEGPTSQRFGSPPQVRRRRRSPRSSSASAASASADDRASRSHQTRANITIGESDDHFRWRSPSARSAASSAASTSTTVSSCSRSTSSPISILPTSNVVGSGENQFPLPLSTLQMLRPVDVVTHRRHRLNDYVEDPVASAAIGNSLAMRKSPHLQQQQQQQRRQQQDQIRQQRTQPTRRVPVDQPPTHTQLPSSLSTCLVVAAAAVNPNFEPDSLAASTANGNRVAVVGGGTRFVTGATEIATDKQNGDDGKLQNGRRRRRRRCDHGNDNEDEEDNCFRFCCDRGACSSTSCCYSSNDETSTSDGPTADHSRRGQRSTGSSNAGGGGSSGGCRMLVAALCQPGMWLMRHVKGGSRSRSSCSNQRASGDLQSQRQQICVRSSYR